MSLHFCQNQVFPRDKIMGKMSPNYASCAAPWPLKYLFLKDLARNEIKNKLKIQAKLLIYKYLTGKSLFLKDLASLAR